MKKIITVMLVFALCMFLFAGCSSKPSGNDMMTETIEVLYVEKDGFITRLSNHICYVEYPNADAIVTVGQQATLKYAVADHVVVVPERELGGYQWDTVLTKVQSLSVK
jgi:hypothetical protein